MSSSFWSRPVVGRLNFGAWLVLLATLPLGLYSYFTTDRIGFLTWKPGETMGINFRTYHYAVDRARDGVSFYDVTPLDSYEWAVYLYPPGTLPSFYPFTVFQWTTGYLLMTGLSVVAAVLGTWLLVRYVESLGPQLGWIDVGLIFAPLLLSTHAYGTIYYGNINILLVLGIVTGFWALHRGRGNLAGVSFGLTALFKLFPTLIGLWLLREREWEAVGAATVTGLVGLLVGVVLYGFDTTRYYFTDVVAGRTDAELFTGGYPTDSFFYITIQRPISHLLATVWPSVPYVAIVAVSVLLCGGILAYFYADLTGERDRQMAILATLVVMLIVVPSLQWYLVLLLLPVVTLLYTWRAGPGRYLFLAGGVLYSITGNTEDTLSALELAPDGLETVGYPVAVAATPPLYGLLLMLVGCAWHKYRAD